MISFIARVIIFALISMLCFTVFGQGLWENEIWNEEKGEWEIQNKAKVPEADGGNVQFPVYTEEWARYLPSTARNGKRPATAWELREAQRKLWVKEIRTMRAMASSQQRRELIAYRKVSGWYGARRAGNHSGGLSWAMQMHVRAVGNHLGGGGYNGY